MAKLKHILEIERGVRAMDRDIQIDYRSGTKGHPVLIVCKGDRKGVFALSCSPRRPDECVRMTLKKIHRYFGATP